MPPRRNPRADTGERDPDGALQVRAKHTRALSPIAAEDRRVRMAESVSFAARDRDDRRSEALDPVLAARGLASVMGSLEEFDGPEARKERGFARRFEIARE